MGCGASAQCHPQQEDKEPEIEPVETSWATKTAEHHRFHAAKDASSGAQGSHASSYKRNDKIIMLDAEDSNDEIEIIYESPSKRQAAQLEAANGQEPPEAFEAEARMEPKPLSKQQQEEAAKLAESRKRFDPSRYQREQRAPENFQSEPSFASKQGSFSSNTLGTTDPVDRPMVMLGLNTSSKPLASSNKEALIGDQGGYIAADIPGGVPDDEDRVLVIPQPKSRQHDDEMKTKGFDLDEEMLMDQIVDEVDD